MKPTIASIIAAALLGNLAAGCIPKPLADRNFERSNLSAWDIKTYHGASVTLTNTAYQGKQAANLSLVYKPSETGFGPETLLTQHFNPCKGPLSLSLWYNIQPPIQSNNSFSINIASHKQGNTVYVLKSLDFKTTGKDSLGREYGSWYQFGPFRFQYTPDGDPIAFTLGSGRFPFYEASEQSTATILIDKIELTPLH